MSELIAGKTFPWEHIAGFYLRVRSFMPFATVSGDRIGVPKLGAYGLALAELPNPDLGPHERVISLPVENVSDYKSLYRAHLDAGVKAGSNELVVLYEPRKGFFGGRKPSFHVAAYPAGTWQSFFEAVERPESQNFRWPQALFLYQPGEIAAFPASANLFSA